MVYKTRPPPEVCSRRISGYSAITSLMISFGTPSISGAVFALSLPPALPSPSRMKSSSLRTTQDLRSCLWNDSTCRNKFRTMYKGYFSAYPAVWRWEPSPASPFYHSAPSGDEGRASIQQPPKKPLTPCTPKFYFHKLFTSASCVEERVGIVGNGYILRPHSYPSSLRPDLRLSGPRIHGRTRLARGNTDSDVCVQYALPDQGPKGAGSWSRMAPYLGRAKLTSASPPHGSGETPPGGGALSVGSHMGTISWTLDCS